MDKLYLGQTNDLIDQFGSEGIEFVTEENADYYADEFWKHEAQQEAKYGVANYQKLRDLQELAMELYNDGISQRNIFKFANVCYPEYKLHITSDYKILLPDFDNAEIKLAPVTKALYFLFLRHVHGLRRTEDLPDCKEELIELYNLLQKPTKRGTKPIEKLLDKTTSSFDDSCVRIKNEFLKYMDKHDAEYYCISGKKDELKGIMMHRYLLEVD